MDLPIINSTKFYFLTFLFPQLFYFEKMKIYKKFEIINQ